MRHVVEVSHSALGKYRVITDASEYIARNKADAQLLQWHQQWQRQEESQIRKEQASRKKSQLEADKQHREALLRESMVRAEEETSEAQAQLKEARSLLVSALPHKLTLTSRSSCLAFSEDPPTRPQEPKPRSIPEAPAPKERPDQPEPRTSLKPDERAPTYHPKRSLPEFLRGISKAEKTAEGRRLFEKAVAAWEASESECMNDWKKRCEQLAREEDEESAAWEQTASQIRASNLQKTETHKRALGKWKTRQQEWERRRREYTQDIADRLESYRNGDPESVVWYLEAALARSLCPIWMPRESAVAYDPEVKLAVVDLELPEPAALPTVREVVFVKSKHEFTERHLAKRDSADMYDSAIYQIALRTLFECFSSTRKDILDAVVFNGFVTTTNAATGKEIHPCILSVQTSRAELEAIDLERVDAKECVRALRGVGSSKLSSIAPVAPLLILDKADSRFIDGRDVVEGVDQGTNLAAMPWDDFEHLIRQLFETMFADQGAEVKVTQASRDRGVDAIVFDPHPITGGKIIIQAKRYTNPVKAGDVRELFGVVQHEGAKLGILVTTSNYGPDAIKWASDKPLTLLNGGNLLHELEKQGHRAYIDIAEAKTILKEIES